MRQYDQKRYAIAPWRGRYGDQAHRLRLHPNQQKIKAALEAKKKELLRVEQQIRQLELLLDRSKGTIIDGVLVHQNDVGGRNYSITLASDHEYRSAQIYPNAHNSGRTFGLKIYRDGYPFHKEEWMGAGHTLEQATEGAKAWVLRGEKGAKRYDTKDGKIREER